MVLSPSWLRGIFVALACALVSGQVFAGGSPRAFEKFTGNYNSTGKFQNQTTLGTVRASISASGNLETFDSPKSAVLTLTGKAVTTKGVETGVTWTLDFRTNNVCGIKVVFDSGTTMTMSGKYDAKKRRVSFSGQSTLTNGSVTKFGLANGRLRLSATTIKYFQENTYADQQLVVRQTLTRQ